MQTKQYVKFYILFCFIFNYTARLALTHTTTLKFT